MTRADSARRSGKVGQIPISGDPNTEGRVPPSPLRGLLTEHCAQLAQALAVLREVLHRRLELSLLVLRGGGVGVGKDGVG